MKLRVISLLLAPVLAAPGPAPARPEPHGQSRTVPHSQSSAVPHDQSRAVPHDQSRAVPHGQSRAVPHDQSRAVPHDQSRAVPHDQSRAVLHGTPDEGRRRFRPMEGEHQVKVEVLNRHGRPPSTEQARRVYFHSLDGTTASEGELDNGRLTGRLATGDYAVFTYVDTLEADGRTSLTTVYKSRVRIDKDTAFVLDARHGRPVTAAVDRADARPVGGWVRIVQKIGDRVTVLAGHVEDTWWDHPTYLTPAEPAPGLEVRVMARLTRNGAASGSPYSYNVAGTSAMGAIPPDASLQVRTRDLAMVRTLYADQGRPGCSRNYVGDYDSDGGIGWSFPDVVGALPVTRTEYFTPGVVWDSSADITGPDCDFTDSASGQRRENFDRGVHIRAWNQGPFSPGPGVGFWKDEPSTMRFVVPLLDAWKTPGDTFPPAHTTATTTLRTADGKVVGTADRVGGDFAVRPEPAAYRLTVDAERRAPWSDLSTRQRAEWTFTTKPPGPGDAVSLLGVTYKTALNEHNQAPAGRDQTLTLAVERGADRTRPPLRRVSVWVSHDDGSSWIQSPVRQTANGWQATLHHPATPGYASLRTHAEDAEGNTVDQTTIRAFGIAR
ncbi:hypothetical protein [Actinomadura rudentiformis]|uniref:hypothetical protein n=1 Tax=Actinomadura rudentiformis TaxID=359158 RepID=UPI00178C302B|nr:hypothetical protein [Actinomadura rudentiformis]